MSSILLQIISVLLLATSYGFAAEVTAADPKALECSEMDESENLGPVRNQMDVGWCFANTGADLLQNAYPEELANVQVSSSFVALQYFFNEVYLKTQKAESVFGSGGHVKTAIQNIVDNYRDQICLQTIDDKFIHSGLKRSLSEKLDFFKDLYNDYQLFYKSTDETFKEKQKNALRSTKDMLIQAKSFLSDYNEKEIIDALRAPTLDLSVMAIIDIVCDKTAKAVKSKVQFKNYYIGGMNGEFWDSLNQVYMSEKFSVSEEINKSLARKKIVGITYNIENVLSNKTQRGPHASAVVGRKYDPKEKKCYFKIRNSWGSDCEQYDEKENKYVDIYEPGLNCKKGNFWLSEDQVNDWVYDITLVAP